MRDGPVANPRLAAPQTPAAGMRIPVETAALHAGLLRQGVACEVAGTGVLIKENDGTLLNDYAYNLGTRDIPTFLVVHPGALMTHSIAYVEHHRNGSTLRVDARVIPDPHAPWGDPVAKVIFPHEEEHLDQFEALVRRVTSPWHGDVTVEGSWRTLVREESPDMASVYRRYFGFDEILIQLADRDRIAQIPNMDSAHDPEMAAMLKFDSTVAPNILARRLHAMAYHLLRNLDDKPTPLQLMGVRFLEEDRGVPVTTANVKLLVPSTIQGLESLTLDARFPLVESTGPDKRNNVILLLKQLNLLVATLEDSGLCNP